LSWGLEKAITFLSKLSDTFSTKVLIINTLEQNFAQLISA